jgi:hypothetical protein
MPSKAVLDAIRDRQAANWTTLAVYYPNDVVSPAADLAAFVQVEFPVGSGGRLTLARDGGHEEVGTIRFVVHCRIKTGTDQAFTYADELAALFRSVQMMNTATAFLETYAPTPPVGQGADVAYYLVSVAVPYRYLFVP